MGCIAKSNVNLLHKLAEFKHGLQARGREAKPRGGGVAKRFNIYENGRSLNGEMHRSWYTDGITD